MPRHSRFPVGAWVDGLVTRRYQVSEQTLYQQRDEFAKTRVALSLESTPVARNRGAPKRANQDLVLAVLFYGRRTESLRECPTLVGNGGAFKICTRHSCLRSAFHPRAR
jgi:hypothetical protein